MSQRAPVVNNAMTVDVEDYFQVSAFERVSPPDTWPKRELRVEANTERILQLLSDAGVTGTFFVLGWVAERCVTLVRRIAAAGHEVACHGYGHRRVYQQRRDEFRQDVRRAKGVLEDLSGAAVLGYRAPSYSISPQCLWAFDELHAAGFRYDSSVFPVRHDLYGMPDWPRLPGWIERLADGTWAPMAAGAEPVGDGAALLEIPITTLRWGGRSLPIAGGGYFRLYPYWFTRWGLSRINRLERAAFIFYIHPWEIDPRQPRLGGAGIKSRFRHYLNLGKTESRLRRLLRDFRFGAVRDQVTLSPALSAGDVA